MSKRLINRINKGICGIRRGTGKTGSGMHHSQNALKLKIRNTAFPSICFIRRLRIRLRHRNFLFRKNLWQVPKKSGKGLPSILTQKNLLYAILSVKLCKWSFAIVILCLWARWCGKWQHGRIRAIRNNTGDANGGAYMEAVTLRRFRKVDEFRF